jgi:hypothetical protein
VIATIGSPGRGGLVAKNPGLPSLTIQAQVRRLKLGGGPGAAAPTRIRARVTGVPRTVTCAGHPPGLTSTVGQKGNPPMLWWLVGLWLLSPALFPIVWLFGMLTSSSRSEHDAKTPGAIGTFAESAPPIASYRTRGPRAQRPFVP